MLYHLIRPLLFRLDAERAHDAVTAMLRAASRAPLLPRLIGALYAWNDPALAVEWAGLRFASPLGVAAGFDKRADLVDALALLGFSHVEVGTVTPQQDDRCRLLHRLTLRRGVERSPMRQVEESARDAMASCVPPRAPGSPAMSAVSGAGR